jgi:probable HAF family extracellular repeat protein
VGYGDWGGSAIPYHAILWDHGAVIDLGTLPGPGGEYSFALGINNQGQIVGRSGNSVGAEHAVLWDHGTVTDLGTASGGTYSRAYGINNRGVIAGESNFTESGGLPRATLWTTSRP